MLHILAIVIGITCQLGQGKVVPLERPEAEVFELAEWDVHQSLLIVFWHGRHGNDVEEDLVAASQLTSLAADVLQGAKIGGASGLDDVDVGGGAEQSMAFRKDEAAEAVQLGRTSEPLINLEQERSPGFAQAAGGHGCGV
ncbi:MAG: hypothetical protein Q8L75_18180 [Acidobacteriota bacterium]|nr:hypothetical protein [Acidobacteriota bacterium]